ncbi:MAG: hypothetical protein ACREOL_07465 [Candidatus Dormibacteria bacterium]
MVLLALALAGILAYLDKLVWVFVLLYSVLLALALAAAWTWWCCRHLRLDRDGGGQPRVVGEQLLEKFRLQNDSGLPIRLAEVRDRSPLADQRPRRVISLAPRQIVTWESRVHLGERGRFELGPTELRLSDPFGLFQRRLLFPARETLLVHPQLVTVAARSLPGADPTPRRRKRDGGRYIPEVAHDLLVLLDLNHLRHRGDGADSTLEYALTVAGSVARAAAQQGRSVALTASGEPTWRIPAGRGEIHERHLFDYLAVAGTSGRRPFAELVSLEMAAWGGRGGTVLITPDRDSEWVAAAAAATRPGERPLAVLLDPVEPGMTAFRLPAQWRLVLDLWVVHHADDLLRLDLGHGREVV